MKPLKILLSPLAILKIDLILEYLDNEWSEKERESFLQNFTGKATQITLFPKSCPESKLKRGLYKGIVDKHISFYYRITVDRIEIITVFDNRQNPDLIKLEMEDQS